MAAEPPSEAGRRGVRRRHGPHGEPPAAAAVLGWRRETASDERGAASAEKWFFDEPARAVDTKHGYIEEGATAQPAPTCRVTSTWTICRSPRSRWTRSGAPFLGPGPPRPPQPQSSSSVSGRLAEAALSGGAAIVTAGAAGIARTAEQFGLGTLSGPPPRSSGSRRRSSAAPRKPRH